MMNGLALSCASGLVAMSLGSVSLGAFGVNLVENGNFEVFTPDEFGQVIQTETGSRVSVEGWAVLEGMLYLERYADAFYDIVDPPAEGLERQLFGGDGDLARISQDVDLGFLAGRGGGASFELSAWLGSYNSFPVTDRQSDIATLTVRFFDELDGEVGLAELVGPDLPSDVGLPDTQGNFNAFYETGGLVPMGAVRAVIEVGFDRDDDVKINGFNNANVDVIEFRVVPSPGGAVVFAVGAWVGRRQRVIGSTR